MKIISNVVLLIALLASEAVFAQETKIIDITQTGRCLDNIGVHKVDGSNLVYLIEEANGEETCLKISLAKNDDSVQEATLVCRDNNNPYFTEDGGPELFVTNKIYFVTLFDADLAPRSDAIYAVDKSNFTASRILKSYLRQTSSKKEVFGSIDEILAVAFNEDSEKYYISYKNYSANHILLLTNIVASPREIAGVDSSLDLVGVKANGTVVLHGNRYVGKCSFTAYDSNDSISKRFSVKDFPGNACDPSLLGAYYYVDELASAGSNLIYNAYSGEIDSDPNFRGAYFLDLKQSKGFTRTKIAIDEPIQHYVTNDFVFSSQTQYNKTNNTRFVSLELINNGTEAVIKSSAGNELILTHQKQSTAEQFRFKNTPDLDALVYSFPACSE